MEAIVNHVGELFGSSKRHKVALVSPSCLSIDLGQLLSQSGMNAKGSGLRQAKRNVYHKVFH